jgi:hypothetical protein
LRYETTSFLPKPNLNFSSDRENPDFRCLPLYQICRARVKSKREAGPAPNGPARALNHVLFDQSFMHSALPTGLVYIVDRKS